MSGNIESKKIQAAIREKYIGVAHSIEGRFRYPTGTAGAEAQGYDTLLIQSAPHELLHYFCGVGNPFSLGPINPGDTVLDIGCGAGFDLYCAHRMVEKDGRVSGIDLTPEMIVLARRIFNTAGITEVNMQVAASEYLPFKDETFDVIISNGTLNLSPEKEKSFAEIYRVLKPAGRLQFADMVLRAEIPPDEVTAKAWSE